MNVISGESHMTLVPGPSVMTHVRSNRVRALGTGGEKRSPLTPDIPTIAEQGVPGFVSTGWMGLLGPKGMPKPIYDKIYGSLAKMMNDPVTKDLFEKQGAEPMFLNSADMVTMKKFRARALRVSDQTRGAHHPIEGEHHENYRSRGDAIRLG